MRENLQEDIFLPCDDRLVAVNVGPDGTYGSLVYDTNQNNEYDAERSAFLQSAFRVLKKPVGAGYNAIGFQLYLSGNKDTKGGFFVDQGDGSTTTQNTPTGGTAAAGSGMIATGGGAQRGGPAAPKTATSSYTTQNAGASGGTIIGQGSFNDGGVFHVGNKKDKHFKGTDADGNPINALHIHTKGNFYKNQVEDGPLRFEDIYQIGNDQSIVVPVHLGWAGTDWAWWTTSYFYQPPSPTPTPYPYPPPGYPPTPTPGTPTPTPTPGGGGYPPTPTPGGGYPPTPTPGGGNPVPTDYPPTPTQGGGSPSPTSGALVDPTPGSGGAGPGGPPIDTGNASGSGGIDDPSAGFQNGLVPVMQPPTTGGDGTLINPYGPGQPIDPGIPPPPLGFDIPYDPSAGFVAMVGSSVDAPAMSMISSTLPINSNAGGFQASNYSPNSLAPSAFSGATSGGDASASANKANSSAPQTGGYSCFGDQGSPSPSPAPTPSPAPSPGSTGGSGDPWVYTSSPKGKNMHGIPMGKFRGGTANGGIVYHPPETDLRDIPKGLVPSNVTLSTMYVLVGPGAYFGSGVPNLNNGSIKSGYRWGPDSSTGDLVLSSISNGNSPIEAMRLTNTGQNIQWQAGTGFNGILTHANTGNRTYTFPNLNGTVHLGIISAASGGGAQAVNGTVGGSGPASATMSRWEQFTRSDGTSAWVQTWV